MLDDRPYMKSSPLDSRPVTVTLLVVLGVVYVIQSCFIFYGGPQVSFWFDDYLALSLEGIKAGRVWQIFTFQFLHQTPMPWHLIFNCIALFFLGRGVEEALGRAGFLWL